MTILEKIGDGAGLIGFVLAFAVAVLWKERENGLKRELERLIQDLKDEKAEAARLRGELAESQRNHLKDAERFLAALEKKRVPSSPPSQT